MDKENKQRYNADYYQRNKEANHKLNMARRQRIKGFIREYKEERACADCGVEYPHYVMDFDHVRGVKDFEIGKKGHLVSAQRLVTELLKCDVVCANCHRIRTYETNIHDGHLAQSW